MHIKSARVPPAIPKALRRPFTQAVASSSAASKKHVQVLQNKTLRQKLATFYRQSEAATSDLAAVEKEEDDYYWRQSGQVLRWIGDHVAKDQESTLTTTSTIPKAGLHRQLVAEKVSRLLDHEPLAYVLGTQPFGPLEIQCKKPILIPRPETEHLFEHLCQLLVGAGKQYEEGERPLKILDMCTGTGCIALLIQHRLQEAKMKAEITAIDKSPKAISLALSNRGIALQGRSELVPKVQTEIISHQSILTKVEVEMQEVDIFGDEAIDRLISKNGPFDVIASNPPYVTRDEYTTLDKNVKDWEDPDALIGDVDEANDGLAFYRRIALLIKQRGLLRSRPTSPEMPSLLVEVGHNQAKAVQDIFLSTGRFSKTDLIKDPWEKLRGVIAWPRPNE